MVGSVIAASAVASFLCCWLTGAFGSVWWLLWLPLAFIGWAGVFGLLAFGFVRLVCAMVDLSVPQEYDSKFHRNLTYQCAHAVLTILLTRVHKSGLEKLPKEGRFMLVCNHLNDIDPVVLLHCMRKSQLAFITKRENMEKPIVGKLMHKLMCQPINRENDREALKTILRCVELLKEDQVSVAVFPEGYTSRDGLLHHFRHGVFKIAQKAKVPVVVCTLRNTTKPFKNAAKLKCTDVHLHLVSVITPEQYQGMTTVELGEKVYEMMAVDLGPELVAEA